MMNNKNSIQQVESSCVTEIANALLFCTNSHVFIYDIEADTLTVSENALNYFPFPSARFSNAIKQLIPLLREEDQISFLENLDTTFLMQNFEKKSSYHVLDKDGIPVLVGINAKLVSDKNLSKNYLIGTFKIINERTIPTEIQAEHDFQIAYEKSHSLNGFLLAVSFTSFTNQNTALSV
ncbi:MAG: hypothetical protein IKI31_03870, partial [Treponema sp.]|nr:hypothetical protein [Treponema sp.]